MRLRKQLLKSKRIRGEQAQGNGKVALLPGFGNSLQAQGWWINERHE